MTTILLIEDDTVLRENTAELLELSNFEVITANNGKMGIEALETRIPDIIICDIMMPELDGYSVLEKLFQNEKTKQIPFIFLSAKAERQDIRQGMNLGADDYITKPFTEEDLLSAIKSRLAKAAILKEQHAQTKHEDELNTLNDLKNFFDDNGDIFKFSKDDIIYNERDHSNYIYLITKGAVKCHKLDEQGKELATGLYRADDFFGYTSFTQNIPYQETAIALKDTELVGVTINELKDILNNNHKVALALMELLAEDLSGIKGQLIDMAYSSVNRKTALTILKFAEKINNSPQDPIRISRSDLASVAGIATETFIRTLTNFKNEGIIISEGRNIRVLDMEKLRHIN